MTNYSAARRANTTIARRATTSRRSANARNASRQRSTIRLPNSLLNGRSSLGAHAARVRGLPERRLEVKVAPPNARTRAACAPRLNPPFNEDALASAHLALAADRRAALCVGRQASGD